MKRSVIYGPRGKAGEYASLALNLYRGCSHGCTYCFAPKSTFIDREKYHDPAFIKPRRDILEDLQVQAMAMAGDPREILLCFTCDPYQPMERETMLTRRTLAILVSNRLRVTILTKAGPWGLVRDRDILKMNHLSQPPNTWAVSLTFDDYMKAMDWEPLAASPAERVLSLRLAKEAGLNTWVSFEPVIDPEAVYHLLDATYEFVDFYKVGKLNYHPRAQEIDWRRFKMEMEERLTKLGKPYYLKKDLIEAAKA